MAEVYEIIEYIKDKIGADDVSEDCDVFYDLGIDGDDCDEFLIDFSKKYNVDMSTFLWYFHSSEEGSWNSIGGAFFKSPNKRVARIPITPIMLSEFTKSGRWTLQYPEHSLPKRRYDIIINQLLVLAFVVFILYRCSL